MVTLQFEDIKIKSKVHSYSVKFVDNYLDSLQTDIDKNTFVVIDYNVLKQGGHKLLKNLRQDKTIAIEAAEENKTYNKVSEYIGRLLARDIRKNSKLIAIGGGVIQDITGFIASILFRGIEWIYYPTTLLAQADSCIGSKTSINFGKYKNQIGTFYPPTKIVLDMGFLKTLHQNDICSGMGEIIKVHFIDGQASVDYIKKNYELALENDKVMADLIHRSLMIKKRFIERDEFDKDYRNILNYGHTFGHAVETLTNNKIPHGRAVVLGMCMANYVALKYKHLTEEEYEDMVVLLEDVIYKYPFTINDKQLFVDALARDKKNTSKSIMAILPQGIGDMVKTEVTPDMLETLMSEMVKRKSLW